jgi:hypothetical protein
METGHCKYSSKELEYWFQKTVSTLKYTIKKIYMSSFLRNSQLNISSFTDTLQELLEY